MYSAGELLRQDRAGQNLDALSYHISAWLNSCGSMSTTIHSDSLNAYSCKKNNHAVFTYSQLGQIQDLSGMVGYSLHFQQTCKCFLSKSTGCLHFSWVEVEVYEPLPPIWIRSQCRGHPLPLVMKKGAPNWLKRKKKFGLLTNKAIVFILYKLIFILPVIEIKRTQH